MCLKMSCFYYILAALSCLVLLPGPVSFAQGQLSPSFYDQSCPNVTNVIRQILLNAALDDPRLPASFGCDASILLDDPETTEKTALPNVNSARGYEVVDAMKEALENAGGPSYEVPLGRPDGVTASRDLANTALPAFFESIDQIKAKFAAVGLNTTLDLVALSGN
ncbi:heme peroxidase, plant/fungal/bacterial [Corchorus capsularis]|uniref:peroxidase n=1 Tax=Corchorus capsularis TaxID=210143 RepID=A0A1R3HS21_COCAP|nr:heme peroxidase, plant/fungal/bacterial [Corchorus capsularis]